MLTGHVSKDLSAFCHAELPAAELQRVREHLLGCARCRQEFEEIRLGVKFAEQLPKLTAPESLWSDLEAQLRAPVTGISQEIPIAASWRIGDAFRGWRLATAAAIVLLLIAAGIIWIRQRSLNHVIQRAGTDRKSDIAPRAGWEVARVAGNPQIESTAIDGSGRLERGQWLETDNHSRARIDMEDVGEVEVDPNTRVRLVETKPTEHRLELARGRMSARIWAPPKLFFVDTPSAVAEDLGCAYTLEVDDHGASLLRVTLGWVSLQLKGQLQGRESMVPAGAACATRPGVGPGTPYFEDVSDRFHRALAGVDFGDQSTDFGGQTPLEIVLEEARLRDTLTLWNLLPRVGANDRALVYDRLASLAAPPSGVTREGVIQLNQEMLDRWRESLEPSWYNPIGPLKKGLTKAWTTGLGKINGWQGKK
jgi:hypothetical protein